DEVRVAALPDPPPATPAQSVSEPARPAYIPPPVAAAPSTAASAERGEAVQVAPGDTLYGLSRKHHVAVSELMSVNNLTSPNLK
ncbi:LysM peptidoglycan-binding domain-containing protein, partial [Acinetobacter baumannii]